MFIVIACLVMLGSAFAGSFIGRTYFGLTHDQGTLVGAICIVAVTAIFYVATFFGTSTRPSKEKR